MARGVCADCKCVDQLRLGKSEFDGGVGTEVLRTMQVVAGSCYGEEKVR